MAASPDPEPFIISRFEHGIVRRKVRQLIANQGFPPQDREQLEQELYTRILNGLQSFDPSQAHRNAFVTTIVERSVASIIRDKWAVKRDHRRICSIHEMVPNEGGSYEELANILGSEAYDSRRGCQPRADQQSTELCCDVASCLSELPPELRELAEALKEKTLSEIARERRIPRTTLQHHLLQLRRHFEKAGMRFYL